MKGYRMSVLGLHEAPHLLALSDGAATGLIIAVGAGGSFVLVVLLTVITMRRSERKTSRERQMAAVGGRGDGQDAYPPQPYSADEPRSHRPYSKQYRIPRQDTGRPSTNGSRPAESGGTGVSLGPWPPKPTNDEDTPAG